MSVSWTTDNNNETQVSEFILLGFSYDPQTKIVLFVVFLATYLVNVTANSLFIIVTVADSQLHTPMYFFLCNLSVIDFCFSSANVPTALKGLLFHRITISFRQCITQMYIGVCLGQSECFLLTVMAWDRYLAIRRPLNYQQTMTNRVCIILAINTWAFGFLLGLTSVVSLPWLHFCGHNVIDHTVCEVEAVSRLTCMDNGFAAVSTPIFAFITLVVPVMLILFTYIRIISTILRMATAESRHRTFTTCGSHLAVVVFFFGTAMMIYLRPRSITASERDKSMSLFYGLVVPAVNPLIYALRNKEVKRAVKKLYIKSISCQTVSL